MATFPKSHKGRTATDAAIAMNPGSSEVKSGPPMRVLAVGPQGILLTDGIDLFWVAESPDSLYQWHGMKVDKVDAAFYVSEYTTYCGGEIDMRQGDDDTFTPEVREIGDRVAVCLSEFFTQEEQRAETEWKQIKEGK